MRSRLAISLLIIAISLSACATQGAAPTAPTAVPTPAAASAPTAAPVEQSPSVSATGLPEVNPLEVEGDILTAGSSTVFPLSEAIAEQFRDEGYAGNLTIDSIGSGAGFERFCKTGETDVANASRAIKDSERESCKAIDRDPIEFRVGTDALAVVVNPQNDWLADGVTMDELAAIFSAEATNWSDVNPAWPAEPIKRFTPGTDSGTFDFFVEAVMDPAFDKKGEEAFLSAGNLQLSEDDNVLVQGVAGDKYGIGFFGFAYFMENQGRLTAVKIDGVAPTAEAVDAGAYKLARPLFIYSDAGVMTAKPQVAAFINYFLTNVNDVIARVGYFPAPADALENAVEAWQAAVK